MRTNMPKPPGSNPFKGRMFKIGLQFSLIAVVFIIIFAAFYACQASSKPKFDYDNVNLIQYKVPSDDTPVAVFETSKGTFKAVIYKDEVPNFAEYFIKLVNNGYYNGTHVFAVQKDVEGLSIEDEYELFDLMHVHGTYDEVFDAYFAEYPQKRAGRVDHLAGYTSWYNY